MKKYIIFMIIILGMPSWAVCPIGESVCTLPDSGITLFQNQNASGLNMNMGSMPSNSEKTRDKGSSFNRTLNQNGIRMQGNLGCQFGNCNKTSGNNFLPDR
jgi:hypothetical protein